MSLRIGARSAHSGLTHVVTTETWRHITASDEELADFTTAGDIMPYATADERAAARQVALTGNPVSEAINVSTLPPDVQALIEAIRNGTLTVTAAAAADAATAVASNPTDASITSAELDAFRAWQTARLAEAIGNATEEGPSRSNA